MNMFHQDLMELVCENGQINLRGQSKRAQRIDLRKHSDTRINSKELSENECYEVLEHGMNKYCLNENLTESQVVPQQENTDLVPPLSSNYLDDAAGFMMRSQEKSTRIDGTKEKVNFLRPQHIMKVRNTETVSVPGSSNWVESRTLAETGNDFKFVRNFQTQENLLEKMEPILPDEQSTVRGAPTDQDNCCSLQKGYESSKGSTHSSDDEEEEESDSYMRKVPSLTNRRFKRRRRVDNLHNERRRRNKINKKMRALQQLIPNCNTVDKASVLDEAIEYLKTLQLQVQMMMFMRSRLYMPQVMLPFGMHQQIYTPYMPNYSPMPMEMLMSHGYNPYQFTACSPIQGAIPLMPMLNSQFLSSIQDYSLQKINPETVSHRNVECSPEDRVRR